MELEGEINRAYNMELEGENVRLLLRKYLIFTQSLQFNLQRNVITEKLN